jgi:ferredoxin-type protein NapH
MLKITGWKLVSQILLSVSIVYLGVLGVRMIAWGKISLVLPTFSCYYLDNRIASCFIRSLQEALTGGWKSGYTTLIVPTVMFVVLGAIFGRSWCSWVCPMGFIQDLFTRIRAFFKVRYHALSEKHKTATEITKWGIVSLLVLISLGIGIPAFFLIAFQYDLNFPFCQICPDRQISPMLIGKFNQVLKVDSGISTLTTVMGYLGIGTFVFFVMTTSFIRRMWCRLCPMGALLGLLNKVSFLSLHKEVKRCTKCGICQRSCPVQVQEVYEEKKKARIDPHACTLCYRCVEMCPEDKALQVRFLRWPIVSSKYKRFLKSGAVKVSNCKRRSLGEKQQ